MGAGCPTWLDPPPAEPAQRVADRLDLADAGLADVPVDVLDQPLVADARFLCEAAKRRRPAVAVQRVPNLVGE